MNWFGDAVKQGIIDCAQWVAQSIFTVLSPFVIWGCRVVIVWCIVTVYCTKDKKQLSLAFKTFLVFLLFVMIKGAIG